MHFQPSRRAIMLSRVSRVSRARGTLTLIVWAKGRLGSKGDRGMGVWVSMGNSMIKMLNLKK